MKIRITGLLLAALLLTPSAALLAQGQGQGPGAGRNGKGYAGPPQTEEERAQRQADCLEKNGGVCPNGGPRENCPGLGAGQGKGKGPGKAHGKAGRHGLRDGTGPRAGTGNCPASGAAGSQ